MRRGILKLFKTVLVAVFLACPPGALASQKTLIIQSTTSTEYSGLFEHLVPTFEKEAKLRVRVVAVGTGAALRNAMNCDGDILLVHNKTLEEKFVAEGYAEARYDVMYNDFVIVGPSADPAFARDAEDLHAALNAIANSGTLFVSRGDGSGTHQKELALWKDAGREVETDGSSWYLEVGSGMGTTLNIAIGKGAYTLTDRASWEMFGNKMDFEVLVEGDKALFNQYGVMAVSAEKCPNTNVAGGQAFLKWLISDDGQGRIAAFKPLGKQLFFPNAR